MESTEDNLKQRDEIEVSSNDDSLETGCLTFKKIDLDAPEFEPHRVFMNNVDSYHGHLLARFIAKQVVGGTKSKENDEEEEQDEEDKKVKSWMRKKTEEEQHYEVVGTMVDLMRCEPPKEVSEIYDSRYKTDMWLRIWNCGFVIYDITSDPKQVDEAMWAITRLDKEFKGLQQELPQAFAKLKEVRCFILISTVMTWGKTRPVDPDDLEAPFTEADFRKRKPHPDFKRHCDLEKEVIQIAKRHKRYLKALVICCGLVYGVEEGVLHFLFKMAWKNEPELSIFASGKQKISLLHIDDLCNIVLNVMVKFPENKKFILAVGPEPEKLKSIVKAIGKTLSTGKVKNVNKEEALKLKGVTEMDYEMLTVSLNIEPSYIVEEMGIEWRYATGFVENINSIVQEFLQVMRFKTYKALIYGPPLIGKTLLAKRLCEYYNITYLHVRDVVDDILQTLKDKFTKKKVPEEALEEEVKEEEEDEDEEEEEEEEDDAEEAKELYKEAKQEIASNNGKLNDDLLLRFLKMKISESKCQNQGFVLDGFPKSRAYAELLFRPEDEEEERKGVNFSKKAMPEFIFKLEASDDFLCTRALMLPLEKLENGRYSEDEMERRLEKIRKVESDEESSLFEYFDVYDVPWIQINTEDDDSPDMDKTFNIMVEKMGIPDNYDPSPEELMEILRRELAAIETKELETQKRPNGELKERMKKIRREKLKCHEQLARTMKDKEMHEFVLRQKRHEAYLKESLNPTLRNGLEFLCKVQPHEPLDYLAGYLFKNNPNDPRIEPDIDPENMDFVNLTRARAVEGTEEFHEFLMDIIAEKERKAKEKEIERSGTSEKTSES